MRKKLSYILTTPAFCLIWLAEKIRGEKIAWRFAEVFNDRKIETKCSMCGHKGVVQFGDKLK